MPTLYVRKFDLKPSLSDSEVLDFWKLSMNEMMPAMRQIEGVNSVKVYSGAGGLVGDLRVMAELENAGVYEQMLVDPRTSKLNARGYTSIDMRNSSQLWLREITPGLVEAMGTTE